MEVLADITALSNSAETSTVARPLLNLRTARATSSMEMVSFLTGSESRIGFAWHPEGTIIDARSTFSK